MQLAHLAFFALLSLSLSFPLLNPTIRSDQCPVLIGDDPPRQDRIISGDLPNNNLRQYMVAFVSVSAGQVIGICTAAFITPRHLVTAAHCYDPNFIQVALVAAEHAFDDRELVQVRQMTIHPNYNPDQLTDDIAVVELVRDVPNAKVMHINVSPGVPAVKQPVRSIGYGRTDGADPDSAGLLLQVDLPTQDPQVCVEAFNRHDNEAAACIGYGSPRTCSACQGDSGGPVIQYKDGVPVVTGVVSYGKPGCVDSTFVMYRTAYYRTFLEQYTGSAFRAVQLSTAATGSGAGSGLAGGAIAGIVIGALVAVSAAVVVAILIVRRRKADDDTTAVQPNTPYTPPAGSTVQPPPTSYVPMPKQGPAPPTPGSGGAQTPVINPVQAGAPLTPGFAPPTVPVTAPGVQGVQGVPYAPPVSAASTPGMPQPVPQVYAQHVP